jgi:hypothetical protein
MQSAGRRGRDRRYAQERALKAMTPPIRETIRSSREAPNLCLPTAEQRGAKVNGTI